MKRFEYIDTARGIGIILVILGHAMIPRSAYIYSFHMPLFFFISGYLYKQKGFWDNLLSKINRIYIPYLFFNFLTWIFFLGIKWYKEPFLNVREESVEILKVSAGLENSVPQNGPLWFLLCLFTVSVLYNILKTFINDKKTMHIAVIIISLSGYLLYRYGILLPFEADTAFTVLLFFHTGYFLSNSVLSKVIEKKQLSSAIVFLAVLIHFAAYRSNLIFTGIDRVSLIDNITGNYILFITAVFSGIFFTLRISVILSEIKLLKLIGIHSLVIFAVHYPILQYIERIHPVFRSNLLIFDIISSLLTLLMIIPAVFFFKKYLPGFSGYRKLIKPDREI